MHRLMKPSYIFGAVIIAVIIAIGWGYFAPFGKKNAGTNQDGSSSIIMPKLTPLAAKGQIVFNKNCSRCHGINATGTYKGPPLINDIYNPGHHGDIAFYRAAKLGSPQHHWPYGNMPPQPQVTKTDIASIVRFIREVQEANGIFYHPHRM